MLTYDYIEKLIAKVRIAYPFNYKNFTDQDFELLVELWHEDLSEHHETIISEAFKQARQSNKISVTTADIIEQIEKIQSAFSQSEQEMWAEFMAILAKAERLAGRRHYTLIESNGKAQGENAIDELRELYDNSKPEYRRYIGDIGALIRLSEMSADDLMQFERPRFIKAIKNMQAETKIQETYPALGDMVKGLLKE